MIIKLDISKLERDTIVKIAEQTEDVSALEWLAQINDANIVTAVIQNSFTTKEIREFIYRKWKNERCSRWVVRTLSECPLNNITIRSMVENISKGTLYMDTMVCVNLAKQEEISGEALSELYDLICANEDKNFIEEVLSAMARREDLSEELANKLLKHSPNIASIVAGTYSEYLKINFSEGQKE